MAEYIYEIESHEDNESEIFIGWIRNHSQELIRCKDCKYYTGKWCTKYSTKQFDINDICKDGDDFCSMAERKEHGNR